MIVKEISYYHTNHVFPVLCERMDCAIEDAFVTGLFGNSEAISQELKAAVFKVVGDTIRDRQASSANCLVTCQTLELGSTVRDIPLRTVGDDTVLKAFATHAKRHFDKALEDWCATNHLVKTVAELS